MPSKGSLIQFHRDRPLEKIDAENKPPPAAFHSLDYAFASSERTAANPDRRPSHIRSWRDRFRTLVDSAPDGFHLAAIDGLVQYLQGPWHVNRRLEKSEQVTWKKGSDRNPFAISPSDRFAIRGPESSDSLRRKPVGYKQFVARAGSNRKPLT